MHCALHGNVQWMIKRIHHLKYLSLNMYELSTCVFICMYYMNVVYELLNYTSYSRLRQREFDTSDNNLIIGSSVMSLCHHVTGIIIKLLFNGAMFSYTWQCIMSFSIHYNDVKVCPCHDFIMGLFRCDSVVFAERLGKECRKSTVCLFSV